MFELTNKTALITGAGSGIGFAIAQRFNQAGANIIIADIKDATKQAEELDGTFLYVDVGDEQSVRELMMQIGSEDISLDILVNNAGIMLESDQILNESEDAFKRHFEVNTLGTIWCIKYAVPIMQCGSSIVNIGSIAAVLGMSSIAAYSISKSSVIGVTKVAAVELESKGIRVNCVCPGSTNTLLGRTEEDDIFTSKASLIGRLAEPEEIAAVVHFLASNDASYVNGQVIVADGGLSSGVSEDLIQSLMPSPDVN